MIQVWCYDENKLFTISTYVNECSENMTIVPLKTEFYKSLFNEDNQSWYEGATQEEIDQIKAEQEANKPPTPPDKNTIRLDELSEYVLELEMKNLELEETSTLNSEYVLDLDTRLTNIELQQTI